MRNVTPLDDVRAAVRWALSHDLTALLAYREVTHLDKAGRWQADATLVAHWQEATGAESHALPRREEREVEMLSRRR